MTTLTKLRVAPFLMALVLCLVGAPMGVAYADTTDLSTTPPDVTVSVAPNIAVTFDDSGSMGATHLPDGLDSAFSGNSSNLKVSAKYYFSSNTNSQYYNPTITYLPPLKSDGVTRFDTPSYTNAPRDGICATLNKGANDLATATTCAGTNSAGSFFVDLSQGFRTDFANQTSSGRNASVPGVADIDNSIGDKGGFYYNCPTVNSNNNCTLVKIPSEQQQNFANWYSYYRTRNLSSRSAIANVFATLSSNIRVVWQNLNSNVKIVVGTTKFEPFSSTARANFFSWLYKVGSSGGTESRSAIQAVGRAFSSGQGVTDSTNPYWEVDPSNASKGSELSCRLNYSLLVTDGYWNGTPKSLDTPADYARSKVTLPDGVAYGGTTGSPESKIFWNLASASGIPSMADIAFYYWARNLRPDLVKSDGTAKLDVPPSFTDFTDQNGKAVKWDGTGAVPSSIYFNPANDPATWPHVVQFMIALGINGKLSFPGDYAALRAGTTQWPVPNDDSNTVPENLDDTWHAAVNSRGQYFSARDPAALSTALSTLLTRILGRNTTAAPGALSSSVLTGNGVTYQTGYNSANYSGTLTANPVDVNGNVGAPLWKAADLLTARASAGDDRVILTSTSNGAGKGAAFTSSGAGAALRGVDATISDDMISYLRGSPAKEGTAFRVRASTLGAIINSQVVYVAFPASGYTDTFPSDAPESATSNGKRLYSYEQFVADHAKRAPTIYVGANDGMLHAFDATLSTTPASSVDITPSPGKERWAYVPYSVYNKLSYLSAATNFKFRPTVDGALVTRDVFFSGASNKGWHTILVGSLRLGGRGVYALDITDAAATEAGASSKVLWEFNNTSTNSTGSTVVGANLGYTYGKPNIARLANGKWVVLVPSGYYPKDTTTPPYDKESDSTSSSRTRSSLFVLDAQTGDVITEMQTPTGTTSYGLTSPVVGDYNNDQIDDVAFAGDLVGNLWRFDFSGSDPTQWKVSLAYQPNATSTATNPGPGDQPITTMPRLFPDPNSPYFIVVYGTGKYLGASDNVANDSTKFQSVYGIRDRGPSGSTIVTGRSTLVGQTLAESGNVRGLTTNAVPATNGSGAAINGWYIDLVATSSGVQTNKGERVVVDPTALFDSGRAIITSLIPGNDDPCNPVRRGAILVIDAATGGAAPGVSAGSATFNSGFLAAGARVDNVPISGALPAATAIGGGRIALPGVVINSTDPKNPSGPFGVGDAIWRRRSWRELFNVN